MYLLALIGARKCEMVRGQQEESNPLIQTGKEMLPSSQTVTEQLRQQTHDSQFHGISSLKGEGGFVHRAILAAGSTGNKCAQMFQHCCSNTRHMEASVWQHGQGQGSRSCFMYRGFCRLLWAWWLARVTGAGLQVPETLSLKSYILISVSTTRAQSF